MNYAVIQTGGKQYKVTEGSIIEVEKLPVEAGSDFVFDSVLFTATDGVYSVGQPVVQGVTVTAKVVDQIKGKKIRVANFKAKARYRSVTGHRQRLTKLQIEKIVIKEAKKAKAETS